MRGNKKWQPIALTVAVTALIGFFMTQPAQTQYGGGSASGTQVAVSSSVNNHTHSFGLQNEDIAGFVSQLQNDGDSIRLQSSSAYDGGSLNGAEHTHGIVLTKAQLTQLASGQSVTVQSEEAAGHSHTFLFMTSAQCPGAAASIVPVPLTSPSASPAPSASASPSPRPSISPSPSPSVRPSASPTPSVRPSMTPTATPISTPIATFTPPILAPIAPIAPLAPIGAQAPKR